MSKKVNSREESIRKKERKLSKQTNNLYSAEIDK